MKMSLPLVALSGTEMLCWLCWLLVILLPILFILFIAFYSKKTKHQQLMAAMEKGLPVADFMPKPLSAKEIGIRNLSAGIGFLCIGLGLVGVWYYAIEAPNISVMPNWVAVIGSVIAGMGLLFLCRGLLQMKSSDMHFPWFIKAAIGIGLLSIGLALAVVWWLPIYVANTSMEIWDQKILTVAGVVSGIGILFLCWGLFQRHPAGIRIPWFTKLSAGIGFLFIGLALAIVWWMGAIKGLSGEYLFTYDHIIVAGVISGLGLMLLLMGILQKKSDARKPEKNILNES